MPRFDPLEPRLLLSADLISSAPLLSFPTPLDESALVVDLGQEDQPVQETPVPLSSFEIGQPTPATEDSAQVEETAGPLSDADPFNCRTGGTVNAEMANLASGKTAVASTSYPGFPASNATDGNAASRWSSQFSDSQWICVDLGSVCTIDRIVLRWETAYGRGYKIQVSNNASSWSDVYRTTTGDGGVDDIVLSSPASGRYVRMLGLQRATQWGYSLFEFEVYGGGGPDITVLGNGISIADGDMTPGAGDGTDFGSVGQGQAAVSRTFMVHNDGSEVLTLGGVTVPAGFTLTEELTSSLAPGASDTFTVQLETATPGIKGGLITFANNDSNENPFDFAITGAVLAPAEITVLGNGIEIVDGDASPDPADDTDFGSVLQGAPGITRTFTVRNDGGSTLTLGAVAVPTGFALTEELADSLEPGVSDTFTVQLDTTTPGSNSGAISFVTNDPDENPFDFQITGAVLPAPEITVLGNGVSIVNGDTTPGAGDGTDFGAVLQGEAALRRTFTVRNDGSADLTLDALTVPAGYMVTEGLSASLAPGEADTFTVALDTATAGTYTGAISFATNDSDENPFQFTITGMVTAPVVPEVTIAVALPAVVEDGTTNLVYTLTRSVADSSPLTVSFTVGGTATFATDYTPSGAAGFDATAGTIVIAAHETTATVTVDPTADTDVEADETVILTVTAGAAYTVGTPSVSTGTIQNDDGLGNLARGRPATASTSYTGQPASNATDGNTSSRWSSQFSNNEWIYVDLGSTYTISRVVLWWETAYGRGYKIQVSGNASTWSEVYSTTTGNGAVDDITLSTPASGRYVRMLGTLRATQWGYSLWEFEVYGGGVTNHAPAVGSFSRSLMQDTPLPFAAADFTGAFTDPDAGDSLGKIKITSLPSHGVLRLSGTAVTLNQEIATAQIGALTYTPASGYTGADSFGWNGSDGKLYAATAAAVNLSIHAAVANLALHKPAVASTSYSGLPASNATDGNGNSRWSSQFSNNEWIYVDLGSTFAINRVVLRWETAYGRSYKLQVSGDTSAWSEVYSTTTGDGGVDEVSLSSPALGRYLRMLGTQRATVYGYSLHELEVYGGAAGPEITVLGNGVSIVDGDTTPSTADGTDFGSVVQGGATISRVFTVRNDGDSTLTLGAATVPMGFQVMEVLSSGLAAGASDTFTVQLDANVLGTKRGEISFANNDSNESPFNFAITGTVMEMVPEITVLGNGISIADGDTTPSASDGTDFGSVVQNGGAISRDFAVRNDGTVPLTLGPVTVPTGFILTEALSGCLPAGTSDTFTVRLDTATAGARTGDVSFWTTDSDENPFNFTITGTVTAAGVPEVAVTVAPSEVAEDGAANLVYTFTRSVAGSSSLSVSFSVGGTATYGTDYTPTGAVSYTAGSGTVTIAADQTTVAVTVDPAADTTVELDETVILTVTAGTGYTVGAAASGTGTIRNDDAWTNVARGRPATASTSYSGFPPSYATDGNANTRWSSQFSDSQWLYVDLGSVFTIHQVILRWETAYGKSYRLQVSSDAGRWMDVYATTTGDGGTDDITLSSPASGRYVRVLGTQRGTVYGYSLWELEVYA